MNLDGRDLRPLPLDEQLRNLLIEADDQHAALSDDFADHLELPPASRMCLEGIVSERPVRNSGWIKV